MHFCFILITWKWSRKKCYVFIRLYANPNWFQIIRLNWNSAHMYVTCKPNVKQTTIVALFFILRRKKNYSTFLQRFVLVDIWNGRFSLISKYILIANSNCTHFTCKTISSNVLFFFLFVPFFVWSKLKPLQKTLIIHFFAIPPIDVPLFFSLELRKKKLTTNKLTRIIIC